MNYQEILNKIPEYNSINILKLINAIFKHQPFEGITKTLSKKELWNLYSKDREAYWHDYGNLLSKGILK